MEAEKILIAAIKGVFPQMDVFHDFAPEDAAAPFAMLQCAGGYGRLFLDGGAGGEHRHFLLTLWANSRAEVSDICRRAEAALCVLPRVAAEGAAQSLYDPSSRLRGTRQEFTIIC